MTTRLPLIRSEAELRAELYARSCEIEAPPILSAPAEHRFRLTSALQKACRRGHTHLAVEYALKLHSIDPQYCWRRLAIIALEDVGFGDCLSAALALEACRSFGFRQKLGELRTVATIAGSLADAVGSRSLCDSLVIKGPEYPYPPAREFEAPTEFHAAPWLVQYLAYRGLSHAKLGYEVPPVWSLLTDVKVVENEPDAYGDQIIAGQLAASWDQYVREGLAAMRYVSKCPPFRSYSPKQIGAAVFVVEGGFLNRAIHSQATRDLELDAELTDMRTAGLAPVQWAELTSAVRQNRQLINYARSRIIG